MYSDIADILLLLMFDEWLEFVYCCSSSAEQSMLFGTIVLQELMNERKAGRLVMVMSIQDYHCGRIAACTCNSSEIVLQPRGQECRGME